MTKIVSPRCPLCSLPCTLLFSNSGKLSKTWSLCRSNNCLCVAAGASCVRGPSEPTAWEITAQLWGDRSAVWPLLPITLSLQPVCCEGTHREKKHSPKTSYHLHHRRIVPYRIFYVHLFRLWRGLQRLWLWEVNEIKPPLLAGTLISEFIAATET